MPQNTPNERSPSERPVGVPDEFKPGLSQARILVQGIQLEWQAQEGTCTFQGLPVAMMWVDSTLAGLMSGTAAMVGPERFSMALQSEGRKSVESDWLLISRYPDFRDGFKAIGVVAAVAGWGRWEFLGDTPGKPEYRFRAYNTWEGLSQKKLGICWGSAMLAGKFAGYCTKRFETNCWATQTAFIARGDACDEFVVAPSPLIVEDEIARLLSADQATRSDLAVSLKHLREVQVRLLVNQTTLEQQVWQRTGELAASRDQIQAVNDQLRTEVDGHKRTEEARKQSEQSLRAFIDLAPISIAVVGLDGTIEYINRKSIETFGYRPEDIATMDQWWEKAYPDPVYRSEARQRWMSFVKTAISGGREIERATYRITAKDGDVKTVAVFGMPVAGKVLVMFDDITIQALREDLLRRSHAELERRVQDRTTELAERNQRLQEEIVEREQAEHRMVNANLALERTMSQLRKLGSRLSRAELDERKRIAHILHDQLQQALVAARFSLSVLEQKTDEALQGTVRSARTSVDEALRESRSLVLELSPPILREGGITPAMKWLRLRMHEKYGLTVQVDVNERVGMLEEDLRLAIFHAVRELLLNVVKYAGVTSAEVLITVLAEDKVMVVVADRGCGFDTSLSGRGDDRELGFGLLAVRERFDALGGQMTIDSEPGKGSRITLIAPLGQSPSASLALSVTKERPASAGTPGVADRPAAAASSRIRVLLVDDHVMLRQGLEQLLSQDPGIEIVGVASDGEAAVERARALRPDVILMDVRMPVMGGIEATQRIHAEYPDMIIIGLSMHAEADRGAEMRKAGASAYVSKSEASEVVLAVIHDCCKR
jgi:PAS domain S-box-containing protein